MTKSNTHINHNSYNPFKTEEEFKEVFEEYFNPLVNFTNRYINNWEDSRSIVQDTFMKFWERREKIVIRTSLKSFLFKSTKNNIIDFVRKVKTDREMKEGVLNTMDITTTHSANLDDESILKHELVKAIEKLKPRNKEIFKLHRLEGLTYQEIADHLGISKRTVEDNMARALLKLRNDLQGFLIYSRAN